MKKTNMVKRVLAWALVLMLAMMTSLTALADDAPDAGMGQPPEGMGQPPEGGMPGEPPEGGMGQPPEGGMGGPGGMPGGSSDFTYAAATEIASATAAITATSTA